MDAWGPKQIPIDALSASVRIQARELHARRPLPSYDAAVQEILDTERDIPGYDSFRLRDDGAERADIQWFLDLISAEQQREWEQAWWGEAAVADSGEDVKPLALTKATKTASDHVGERVDEQGYDSGEVETKTAMPDDLVPGDNLYFTGRRDSFADEDTPKHGQMVNVFSVDRDQTRLLCHVPHSTRASFSVPVHLLSKRRPLPLPGNFEPGDFIYYVGAHTCFADGKRLRTGTLCQVAGPLEQMEASSPPSVLVLFAGRPRGEATAIPITQLREQREFGASLPDDLLKVGTAAYEGRLGEVLFFLDRSVEGVNVRLEQGSTLLMQAAVAGQLDIVEALVARKSDLNLQDSDGQTALMCAASAACAGVVQVLLNSGANADIRDRKGRSARDHAFAKLPRAAPAYRSDLELIVQRLDTFATQMIPDGTSVFVHGLKSRLDLNDTVGTVVNFDRATGRYGVNVIGGASMKIKAVNLSEGLNRKPCVRPPRWLLNKFVVIHGLQDRLSLNGKCGTASDFDPATENYEVRFDLDPNHVHVAPADAKLPPAVINVRYLMTVYEATPTLFGAPPSPINEANKLLKMCSGQTCDVVIKDVLPLTLEEGVDPNWMPDSGKPPLVAACEHNTCWQLLVKFGADVNLAALDGTTPLLAACSAGNVAAIKWLLKAPSMTSVDQAGPGGLTPILVAHRSDRSDLVSRLLAANADAFTAYETLRDAEEWGTRAKCDKLLQDEMLRQRTTSLQQALEESEEALQGAGRGADLTTLFEHGLTTLHEAAQNAQGWAERHAKGKLPPTLHKKLESAKMMQANIERAVKKHEAAERRKAQKSTSVLANSSRVVERDFAHVDRWLTENKEGEAAARKRREMARQERERQAAKAERPYSTPGPSHRSPCARTVKGIPMETRLVHEEFISEEARQRRRREGRSKQLEEHEAKVARDQAARDQAARQKVAEESKHTEASQHIVPEGPKLAEVIEKKLFAPTKAKLSAGTSSAREDDISSLACTQGSA